MLLASKAISIASVAGPLLLLLVVNILAKIVYRTLFHSLRSFPGPWLNSVSPIPSAVMLLLGRQHTYNYRLHAKYGPVVRVGPDELSFDSANAWADIYGYRNGEVMEKSPIFIGVVSPLNGYVGIGLASGKEHTRQRRALAPSVSKNALRQQQTVLLTQVHKLVAALRAMLHQNQALDLSRWYSYVTFDIIGDLCFTEPFGCLDQNSGREWSMATVHVLISATWDQAIRRVAGVDTWLWKILVKFVPSKAAGWRKLHLSKTREKTTRRLGLTDPSHRDVIHHLLGNEDPKKALSPTEIVLNMVLFITAGSETTAILLTAFTYCICTNPEVYKLLVSEIRESFKNTDDINLDGVMGLPYLGAAINETLRLFPPGAVNQLRSVPPWGATIDGFHVQGGTAVSVAPWAAGRSPSNFYEPNEFRPERWLENCDEKYANDQLHASQPFGYGPKECLGKNLSYFESRLIISHLLWNFDVELEGAAEHGEQNKLWVMEPGTESIKSFQALVKPSLWVRLKEVQL